MIETVVIISLICLGVNVLFWRNMVLYKFGKALEYTMQDSKFSWILEPLYSCPICMASVYSIIYWIYTDYSFNLIPVMLAVCGLNTVLLSLVQNIVDKDD